MSNWANWMAEWLTDWLSGWLLSNGDVNKATRYKIEAKAKVLCDEAKAMGCKAKAKNFGLNARAKTEL